MRLDKAGSFLFFLCVLLVALSSCEADPRNESHAGVPLESIKKGKTLAARYCGSCHQLPDPKMLDAASWEKGVLPQMGPRLGIFSHRGRNYPSFQHDPNLEKGFYPQAPLVSTEEWEHILNYYTATSPDSLPPQAREQEIQPSLPLFSVYPAPAQYDQFLASFINVTPEPLPYRMVISGARRRKTFFLDDRLMPVDSIKTNGPSVDMVFTQNGILSLNMGYLEPNNGKFGKAEFFRFQNGQWETTPETLFEELQRPVQIVPADLNDDGRQDYLVCEFGYATGALSWMEATVDSQFVRHVLRPLPGATRAYINDWNGDGLPDLWVLFAQGDEGIFLYTNKGGGTFDEQRILQFPPMYGSSYFELADFNNDGHPDIVYTCGDNADYSLVLKPYHGVYIFLNDGKNRFSQDYFFPVNGCYKAMAMDFDGDGDLDLATISFFADYTLQPEEGFVYLENTGNMKFRPYTVPEATLGRWLTMDAGDVDGDGRIDIVLGNFFMGPTIRKSKEDWSKAPSFLVLKNTGKK